MYGNMNLGSLIDWLEKQDQELVVKDGFGSPHSDRGSYDELAFDPAPEAKISDMLKYAKSADGAKFEGWKGGVYKMDRSTSVYIGEYGSNYSGFCNCRGLDFRCRYSELFNWD